jgi:hypothetical protein
VSVSYSFQRWLRAHHGTHLCTPAWRRRGWRRPRRRRRGQPARGVQSRGRRRAGARRAPLARGGRVDDDACDTQHVFFGVFLHQEITQKNCTALRHTVYHSAQTKETTEVLTPASAGTRSSAFFFGGGRGVPVSDLTVHKNLTHVATHMCWGFQWDGGAARKAAPRARVPTCPRSRGLKCCFGRLARIAARVRT